MDMNASCAFLHKLHKQTTDAAGKTIIATLRSVIVQHEHLCVSTGTCKMGSPAGSRGSGTAAGGRRPSLQERHGNQPAPQEVLGNKADNKRSVCGDRVIAWNKLVDFPVQ